MDYIINFLSLLIIWSVIYYYINNYKPSPQPETFLSEPKENSGICNFKPWGFTIDACVVRCEVSGKTLVLEPEIGRGCTKSKCTDICSKCSDPSCKWLNPPKTLTQTQTETHNKMICLPGNKQVHVYFYHDFTTTSTTKTPTYKDGFFVLQYYKSRFPHEGIHIVKIPVQPDAQYYNHLINSNIENDVEYTFSLYYSKTDTPTDRSDMGTVIVTPSSPNIVIT